MQRNVAHGAAEEDELADEVRNDADSLQYCNDGAHPMRVPVRRSRVRRRRHASQQGQIYYSETDKLIDVKAHQRLQL